MTRHEEQRQQRLPKESPTSSEQGQENSTDKSKADDLRWPFPAGSQNNTDSAVKLKPYVPPKRRGLNQY